ncbi:MAG: hypothetical protein WA821_16360 [Anaerolineales bacterium]
MSNQPSNSVAHDIAKYLAQLRSEGVAGINQYEQRLRNNAGNPAVLDDLFFEGRAALLFRHNGFTVTIRERPDLQIGLGDEIVYAEVKHFQEKGQDRLDEQAMLEATDLLVSIGDLSATEEVPAWKQIAGVAVRKVSQYVDNAPNILVVESSSESLTLMIPSAVHEYDDEVPRSSDPRLSRLNAIMLVNTRSIGFGSIGPWNVEFCRTLHTAVPLSTRLAIALARIRIE